MKRINGFSLMEMMIVLMIVAIVMAASAPMITKRTARTNSSPWIWNGNNILFNQTGDDNSSAIIGDNNGGNLNSRLRIRTDSPQVSHISFASNDNNNVPINLTASRNSNIWFTSTTYPIDNAPINSIAIGRGSNIQSHPFPNIGSPLASIALGNSSRVVGSNSIAIGTVATVLQDNSIVIGGSSSTEMARSTIIGARSTVKLATNSAAIGEGATIIGADSLAENHGIVVGKSTFAGNNAIAIGNNATASSSNSVAIGNGAIADKEKTIVLGNENTTVIIPGTLKVGKNTVLGYSGAGYRTFISHKTWGKDNWYMKSIEVNQGNNDDFRWGEPSEDNDTYNIVDKLDLLKIYSSDRRLKNVGKAFSGGLAEVKKLEVFNYTFKDDKSKTSRVGVMAQDLQKVFPKAVTKGDDGYLRIRMEDMFYAVVNAVKELDGRVSKNSKRIEELEKQNKELEKLNKEFKKQNEELLKRIEALEKAKR